MVQLTVKVTAVGVSDIGCVRSSNQDVFSCVPEKGVFLVADGMGGQKAGDIAAKMCADHLVALLSDATFPDVCPVTNIEPLIASSIKQVNHLLFQESIDHPDYKGMGTTLVLCFVHADDLIYAHVGDSRIYRFKQMELERLTDDHSLLFELLGSGELTEKTAASFPYKHMLTRAMGIDKSVSPVIASTKIEPGDFFLLCSDGLTNFVSDEEIKQTLVEAAARSTSVQQQLEMATNALVEQAKKAGGGDNITALLAYFEEGSHD